jgi:hypothetical protein
MAAATPARLLAAAAMLAAGCFDTPEPACAFACGDDGACPAAYRCASDGWCKRADLDSDYACGASLLDAAPADAGSAQPDTEPSGARAPDRADLGARGPRAPPPADVAELQFRPLAPGAAASAALARASREPYRAARGADPRQRSWC